MNQPASLTVARDIQARAHADAARERRRVGASQQADTMSHGKRWSSRVLGVLPLPRRAADRLGA